MKLFFTKSNFPFVYSPVGLCGNNHSPIPRAIFNRGINKFLGPKRGLNLRGGLIERWDKKRIYGSLKLFTDGHKVSSALADLSFISGIQ